MRITKIIVYGLFGRFYHDLTLNSSNRITIIYGPNGIGKTTILRIIDNLFKTRLRALSRLPFAKLQVIFDNGARLCIGRPAGPSSLRLTYESSELQSQKFELEPLPKPQELNFPLSSIEDNLPLIRIGPMEWRHEYTGEILELDDVLTTYSEEFPGDAQLPQRSSSIPDWLETIKSSTPVRFIDTERLTDVSTYERRIRYRRSYRSITPGRTVRRYSERLGELVQKTLTEYATLSQSLDRSFPARLVNVPDVDLLSIDELSHTLKEVEERRSEIVDAGLLPQEHESLTVPTIEAVKDFHRSVLTVYAQDAKEKLGVFDDLYARVKTFLRIANARLLYKQVSVSQEGMKITTSDGSDLRPELLSSGEQHEIVLLFDLLFETAKNSLILIDEPELSLHVAWQREVLTDLQELAELSDFRAILATHSPQIIGAQWNLTVQLEGPSPK